MSDYELPTNSPNRTMPLADISDMYKITAGDKKNWDLPGYHVPSTSLYSPRMFKFPGEKKKDAFYEVSKRSKDPDPTSYSPKHDEVYKRHWNKPNGKFLKSKRETITEEACRISPRIPAPNEYHQIAKGTSQPLPKPLLGKFE